LCRSVTAQELVKRQVRAQVIWQVTVHGRRPSCSSPGSISSAATSKLIMCSPPFCGEVPCHVVMSSCRHVVMPTGLARDEARDPARAYAGPDAWHEAFLLLLRRKHL
jgi:hypothetical protein